MEVLQMAQIQPMEETVGLVLGRTVGLVTMGLATAVEEATELPVEPQGRVEVVRPLRARPVVAPSQLLSYTTEVQLAIIVAAAVAATMAVVVAVRAILPVAVAAAAALFSRLEPSRPATKTAVALHPAVRAILTMRLQRAKAALGLALLGPAVSC